MKNHIRTLLLALVMGVPLLTPGALIRSDFTGTDVANNLPMTATTELDSAISISGWALGPGIQPRSGVDHRLAFQFTATSTTSTLAEAIAENEYVTLTVIPRSALDLAGKRVTFGVQRDGWHSPRRYSVMTSVAGFAESGVLFTSAEMANGERDSRQFSFIVPPSVTYENLTGSVEFRIYAHAATHAPNSTSLTAFSIEEVGPVYRLQVDGEAAGMVEVSPDGGVYSAGTVVELRAEPPAGQRFYRWSGSVESRLNPVRVIMNTNHQIRALYVAEPEPEMTVGSNLATVSFWGTARPFTDLMKYARSWTAQAGPIRADPTDIPAGANGYPTPVPFTTSSNVTFREVGATIAHFVGGNHTLKFEGTGSISLMEGPADGSIVYHASGSEVSYTVPLAPPPAGDNRIIIRSSDPNDPVRNIRLYMPGFDGTATFHPEFKQSLASFGCIRFMDWGATIRSRVASWSDRRRPDDFSQANVGPDSPGMALEYVIQLANEMQQDPWICIPHLADDDYVTQAARLIRDRLDPALQVYIEYSNETWNTAPAYIGTHYVREQGLALGLAENEVDAGDRFHALRSARIWQIFRETFTGHDPARVVNVMASFVARDQTSFTRLEALADKSINPTGIAADALAIAPYFGHTISHNDLTNGYPVVEEIVGVDSIESIQRMRGYVREQKQVARRAGVRLICYEGGQHWVGSGSARADETLIDILQSANRDPRMGDRYTEYLDMLRAEGVDLFVNFQHTQEWSQYGSWGIWEFHGQPLSAAPKAAAVLGWIAANPAAPRLSGPILRIRREGSICRMEYGVPRGLRYSLQVSQDLRIWQPVPSLTGMLGDNRVRHHELDESVSYAFWRVRAD